MEEKKLSKVKRKIRPQSAMLILYGDYLLENKAELGIGSIITLFGNFGLSDQAVRSAVSRMCRSGLLKVRSSGRKSFYSLTEYGLSLLTTGARRVFTRKDTKWDGYWNIVTYSIPEDNRKKRDVLRRELSWMGYGTLSGATMISPYDFSSVVLELAKKLGITEYIHIFQAKQTGIGDAMKIVSSCWELNKIHDIYADFLATFEPRYKEFKNRIDRGEAIDNSEYFSERFMLIHDYRRLPFFDPDLPEELLPDNWLRPRAVKLFNDYHELLAEKANRYFNYALKNYRMNDRNNH
ncbi:MAG: hypothetical protein JW712_05300 [Dehalococcoidales bacterium]|nr:hypothetical protein [Dehalococcoidales bacterium]